CQQGSSIPYNF
nr:immunoglobulin light chain junction region [Macaca mulatta]